MYEFGAYFGSAARTDRDAQDRAWAAAGRMLARTRAQRRVRGGAIVFKYACKLGCESIVSAAALDMLIAVGRMWHLSSPVSDRPQPAIDAFFAAKPGGYQLLAKGYQIAVERLS
jgi:hypothetical protein